MKPSTNAPSAPKHRPQAGRRGSLRRAIVLATAPLDPAGAAGHEFSIGV